MCLPLGFFSSHILTKDFEGPTEAPASGEATEAPASGEATEAPASGEATEAPASGEATATEAVEEGRRKRSTISRPDVPMVITRFGLIFYSLHYN